MVSMMNVNGGTTSNYGKHSQTASTVCQLVSASFLYYDKRWDIIRACDRVRMTIILLLLQNFVVQNFIWGGCPKVQIVYIPLLIEKVHLSNTFLRKLHPFHIPMDFY